MLDALSTAAFLPEIYSKEAKEMVAEEIEWMLKAEDDESHEFLRAYLALLKKNQ